MVGHLPAGDLWPDQGQKVNSQNFDSKYLEKSDRYEVGTQGALDPRTHGLSIGTVRLTLDDLKWSKSTPKVKQFSSAYLVHRLCDRAEIL